MNNRKIIVANYRYFIAGGPERYMFNFMREAKNLGITCIPFSVNYEQSVKTEYSKYFVTPRGGKNVLNFSEIKLTPKSVVGLLQSSIYNFEAERKLRQLIRAEKPDAVYILHEINSLSPSIIRAAKKEGVRVVHRISDFFMMCPKLDFLCGTEVCESCMHGNYSKAKKNRCVKGSLPATLVRIVAMRLYSWMRIYDDVDAFVTTCQFTKSKMIEYGIPPEKITCIPTFTEVDSVKPCYENEGYILFLGRFHQQKGAIYAVKAMGRLKDLHIKLKITGDIDNSDECKNILNIIRETGIEDKVEFVGFQTGDNLKNLIDKSLCIVNPAIWYENMPNTVIEAYAHGKPVIASNIGSLSEIVQDGTTGLLFPKKDDEALAKCIRMLCENEDIAIKLGKQARTVCEKLYSKDVHMERLLRLLQCL